MPGAMTVKITSLGVSGNGGQPYNKRGRHEALCYLSHGGERRRTRRVKPAAAPRRRRLTVRTLARAAQRGRLVCRPGDRTGIRQGRGVARSHGPDLSERTLVRAARCRGLGVVLDARGKIVWGRSDIGGDPIVAVLPEQVADTHLAGRRKDGALYIFARGAGSRSRAGPGDPQPRAGGQTPAARGHRRREEARRASSTPAMKVPALRPGPLDDARKQSGAGGQQFGAVIGFRAAGTRHYGVAPG
jgi:hypothetical protein